MVRAWALPRLFAALIETGQQKDGFGATAGKIAALFWR